MIAAAGLSAIWVFRQARILAIVIVAEIVYLPSKAIQLANRLPRLRVDRSISVPSNRP